MHSPTSGMVAKNCSTCCDEAKRSQFLFKNMFQLNPSPEVTQQMHLHILYHNFPMYPVRLFKKKREQTATRIFFHSCGLGQDSSWPSPWLQVMDNHPLVVHHFVQSLPPVINVSSNLPNLSLYGCFQKQWYPQIIHFNRAFHYFHHPFWGTTIFGNTHISRKKKHGCLLNQNLQVSVSLVAYN